MSRRSYTILKNSADRLALSYFSQLISAVLKPIDYTRTKEIPAVFDVSGILDRRGETLRILDVGSPQMLGVSLAAYSDRWKIVYLNPFAPELADMRRRASVMGLANMEIVDGDITDPVTAERLGEFDYIFSCSVFEHIHPEDGGDIIASRNLPGLLKSGGLFVFSVPFYKIAFNEYVDGDVYSVKGKKGEKIFFQRFYDENTLNDCIIKPTGFSVAAKTYIGERFYFKNNIRKRMAHLIGHGRVSWLLGRLYNGITDIFMSEAGESAALSKPYLAIFGLRK